MENVFEFRNQLIAEYSTFSRSFSRIAAQDIATKVARLYSLTRDELRYILDPADVMGDDYPSETFRVLINGELREFWEYRTQRLMLAARDAMDNRG